MSVDEADVIEVIDRAFANVPHPGDAFLLGSHDGEEPLVEVGAFHGVRDWHTPTPEFLDTHYTVLSFFSEGGFRYFLPAFLVADVRDALQTANPVFHLTHGFADTVSTHDVGGRVFIRRSGRSQFINPRRYGAMTFLDYARCRLSVFSREESAAVVTYLTFIRGLEARETDREPIDRALEQFWRQRSVSAPTAADLGRYLEEQAEYIDALIRRQGDTR
jgi:hypothetical protein